MTTSKPSLLTNHLHGKKNQSKTHLPHPPQPPTTTAYNKKDTYPPIYAIYVPTSTRSTWEKTQGGTGVERSKAEGGEHLTAPNKRPDKAGRSMHWLPLLNPLPLSPVPLLARVKVRVCNLILMSRCFSSRGSRFKGGGASRQKEKEWWTSISTLTGSSEATHYFRHSSHIYEPILTRLSLWRTFSAMRKGMKGWGAGRKNTADGEEGRQEKQSLLPPRQEHRPAQPVLLEGPA